MIFKQIDSSVDKTRKTLALFNKDWNTYKSNWQNANGIKGKIGSIFTSSNTNTSIISNEQVQILRNWNNAVAHGCTSQETFNRIIANADDNTKMYFAGLNKGKGSIEGLKKVQNVATQSTIGLTIAQTALNMAISLGLTALISLIVKGYDKLANSVENCKERVDDLISSYKSALETANNNANRVEELADKYEKLSKGVNSLGENVSLTNEEYEEYNSLVNEIAEMFPTLVQGWTDEGTAVLNLKGNIEQLRDAYKEAQQEAYNLLIVSGKDSDGNDIIKQWEDTHDTGFWADLLDLGADDVGGGIAVSDALKQLKAIQNMTAQEYREIERITGAGSRKEIAGLSDIEKDIGYGSYLYKALGLDSNVTDEAFREAQRQARALIQTYNAEIESALADVETLANAYLMTNEDYDKLDEQSKTAASMLVNSLNADIANTFSSKEDVGVYVDKIVQSILSNSKAKDALKGLFTMDTSDMSVDEIKKQTDSYINTIAEVLKEDPIELKTRLGFDDSDTQPLINNVKEKLQDEFADKVGELTLEELKIAADLEVSEKDLLSWDELIAKIREVQGSTLNENPISSFQNAWSNLDMTENDSLKSLKEDLLALAEAGELTVESFNNTTGASDFLAQLGLTPDNLSDIENIIGKINALQSSADQLSSMKKGISPLSENLYNKQKEPEKEIGVDVFAGMDDGLKEQKKEWENYVTILGNASSSIEDVQKATNELATAYVNSNNFLANLTETNKDYYISQLSAMGVENAEEIVTASLVSQKEILALKEQALSITKNGVTDSTSGEITALLDEANASNATRTCLFQLAAAEQIFNNQDLDTSGKISALGDLATAYGQTAIAAKIAAWEQEAADSHTQSSYSEADLKHLQEEIAASIGNTKIDINGSSGGGSGKSGGSGGGSSAAKESIETFDFIETAIKRVESAIERLKTRAEETFRSFTSRGREYKKAISEITKEINIQRQGYDAYMARADSIGLEESWAKQVRDGSINIADVSDDGLKERIKNYKEWYEKALECQEKLEELKKTQKELVREKIELLITKYEKLLAKLESANKRIQNTMDFKETWGFSTSTKDYTKLNKNVQSQIKNIISQSKKLKELQKTVTKGSEAWHEYNERINSNNESIQDLTKTMAENAIASASLAGQSAERKNSGKDIADEKTDTRLSTASTASGKNSLINSKIKNIDARQKNLQTAYDKTSKNRASYGNKILKANKKAVSRKNRKYFTQAIAKVKAGKLISTSTINGIVNAMKSAKGKEYKELQTLLSYCNNYNANKNAEEENKLNLEMYALTAQEEKKNLRQEQLNNTLDANQSGADRHTLSSAESAAAKNQNIDTQMRQSNADVNAYTKAREDAQKDRKTAAGKARFYTKKTYKNLKDKKLKKRLEQAVAAIKAGKKISSDALKAVKEYCQKYLKNDLTYYYNCEAYNEAVENELSAKEAETLAKAQAYAQALQAKREKAANTVAGRDTENELHAATAKNQTSAGAKNGYVDSQIANLSQNEVTYRAAYNDSVADFGSARNVVNSVSGSAVVSEIQSLFVSRNLLIPAEYLEKAYEVSDSFGLACSNYNEALEAMNTAKAVSDLYEQTARTERAALALEKMSNIETDYSHKESVYSRRAARINNAMDITQAKGYQTSTKYYERLIQNEEDTNKVLVQERTDLVHSLEESVSTGVVTKFSDEWYEACGKIDDVTNAIEESAVSLAEFRNQMRQIEWDNFDYLEGRIRDVVSEYEFMINELFREKTADDDIGWMTERGKSAAWLHANSYETYRKQAEDYKEAVLELNRALADDPYNRTLLERREELVKSYQEAVRGAQDEKYAVIDLYTRGYEALSNKLKKLVSEYERLLDAQKDAFDYQNTIEDKTKEISALRKQIEAYAGDISEETKAKVQSLHVSLEEAEKDLEETQYDKYISDTKEMLSELQEDFDEAIQAAIDTLAEHFGELITDMEQTAGNSVQTITEHMTGIGYMPTEEFRAVLNESGISASVSAMLLELKDFHTKMTAYVDRLASGADTGAADDGTGTAGSGAGGGTAGTGAQIPGLPAGWQPPVGGKLPTNVIEAGNINTGTVIDPSVELTPGKDSSTHNVGITDSTDSAAVAQKTSALSYLDKNLKKTSAKRDTLSDINKKFYDKFSKQILTTAQMKELAKLLDVKYDNQKSSGNLYKKLKAIGINGFKKGSVNIPYDQFAFLGEGEDELQFDKSQGVLRKVGQGDMVFDNEMSKRLWEFSQMPTEYIREKLGIPDYGQVQKSFLPHTETIKETCQTNVGDVNVTFGDINLPNVTNYLEFRNSLIKDKTFEKAIETMSVGKLGKMYNSLDKNKYLR